jgi:hypothetical protein
MLNVNVLCCRRSGTLSEPPRPSRETTEARFALRKTWWGVQVPLRWRYGTLTPPWRSNNEAGARVWTSLLAKGLQGQQHRPVR